MKTSTERNRKWRAAMSPAEREEARAHDRAWHAARRAALSPAERDEMRARDRACKRAWYAALTPLERAFLGQVRNANRRNRRSRAIREELAHGVPSV